MGSKNKNTDDVVTLTSPRGSKITVKSDMVDKLKKVGFTGSDTSTNTQPEDESTLPFLVDPKPRKTRTRAETETGE